MVVPSLVPRLRRVSVSLLGRTLLVVTAAAGGLALCPPVARADEVEELSAARAKFQRALELKHASDFSGALKLLREVGQVKMTPQVRYHIATCEENMGQLVAALGGYEIALGQSQEMPEAFVSEVQAAIAGLRARIPKLVLRRGRGAEAATIELDQVKLGEGSIGEEIPLDPGPHALVSEAPGFRRYTRTVTVGEGEIQTIEIELVPEPPQARGPAGTAESGYGVLPYVIGGVGVLGLAAGGVLIPVSQDKVAQAKAICGGTTDCTGLTDVADFERARGLARDARTFETFGWIAAGVGAATLATGVVLWLLDTGPNDDSVPLAEGLALLPSAPNSQAGLSLRARF